MKTFAAVMAVILLFVGAIWLRANTPCGFWKFANASEVPARCLKEFR